MIQVNSSRQIIKSKRELFQVRTLLENKKKNVPKLLLCWLVRNCSPENQKYSSIGYSSRGFLCTTLVPLSLAAMLLFLTNYVFFSSTYRYYYLYFVRFVSKTYYRTFVWLLPCLSTVIVLLYDYFNYTLIQIFFVTLSYVHLCCRYSIKHVECGCFPKSHRDVLRLPILFLHSDI